MSVYAWEGIEPEYEVPLAACGGGGNSGGGTSAEAEIAGSYELYEMTFEGDLFDNDFLVSAEFDMYTMELSPGGTGWLKIDDRMDITWGGGQITVDTSGAVYSYEYENGMITLTETTGDTMTFQKTGA